MTDRFKTQNFFLPLSSPPLPPFTFFRVLCELFLFGCQLERDYFFGPMTSNFFCRFVKIVGAQKLSIKFLDFFRCLGKIKKIKIRLCKEKKKNTRSPFFILLFFIKIQMTIVKKKKVFFYLEIYYSDFQNVSIN